MNQLLLAFLGSLEALAGKSAEVNTDPGDGHLQWIFVGDSPEGRVFAPMIFIDWDSDLVSFSWCASELDDHDASFEDRVKVCLGRIPISFGRTLRAFCASQAQFKSQSSEP